MVSFEELVTMTDTKIQIYSKVKHLQPSLYGDLEHRIIQQMALTGCPWSVDLTQLMAKLTEITK